MKLYDSVLRILVLCDNTSEDSVVNAVIPSEIPSVQSIMHIRNQDRARITSIIAKIYKENLRKLNGDESLCITRFTTKGAHWLCIGVLIDDLPVSNMIKDVAIW